MATTLLIDSFTEANVGEQTTLQAVAAAAATTITVKSIEGFQVGQAIYVGQLSRDGCEKAVIAALPNETTINLSAGLELPHGRYESVTGVVGSQARIYRAANVDGKAPADDAFALLAVRDLDPDQQTTYYRDPDGSSSYWYRYTYYDPVLDIETSLTESPAIRGDDFGHYASINEIRTEAGFDNAYNLRDSAIDQQRRFAEDELNTSLAAAYTTPFSPVPQIIHDLTVQLAAALLLVQYRKTPENVKLLADVRARIKAYGTRDGTIIDDDGNDLSSGGSVSVTPDDSASRMFTVDMRF